MTKTPEKAESRWAELSDEVLESVEASRKQAIEAIPKVVDQVTGHIPDWARRKDVIDAALDLTEELVTGRIEFVRGVVRSAGQAVGGGEAGDPASDDHDLLALARYHPGLEIMLRPRPDPAR